MCRLALLPWAMFVLIMRNPFFFLREDQEPILEVGHQGIHNQSVIINKWVINQF